MNRSNVSSMYRKSNWISTTFTLVEVRHGGMIVSRHLQRIVSTSQSPYSVKPLHLSLPGESDPNEPDRD